MSFARYALGVAALLCVLGSFGAGGFALRWRLLAGWRRAPARLAEVVLGLGLMEVTVQLLGAVGLFSLVPVIVGALIVGGGVWLHWRPVAGGAARSDGFGGVGEGWPPERIVTTALGLLAAGFVLAEWAGPTIQSWGRGILGADSVAYHMPWAASFAQSHQLTSIRYTDIEWLTGFYPATSEMLHGLGIVLMGNDVLSPGLNFLWVALVLLAAWCVGEPSGRAPVTLLAGAIVMSTPMMFFSTAGTADNDVMGVFCLLAAVALWVNAGARPPDHFDPLSLLPAAVAAGLAVSVKLNLVAPVAAVTVAVIAWSPAGGRLALSRLWAGGLVVAGGFWYVRNLFAVGNPLPYFSFGILPTPTPGPTQAFNNRSIVNYLHYPRILTTFFKTALANGLGPWWWALLVAGFAGPLLCVAFGRSRLVRLLGGVALFALIAYLFTPGSASGPFGHPRGFGLNLRYVAPALVVALTATPLAAPLMGRVGRLLVTAGGVALLAATIAQDRLWGPGYSRSGEVISALLVLALGAAAAGWPWPPVRTGGPRGRRVVLATTLILLAAAGAAGGYGGQRHYLRGRYVTQPGLRYITQLWRWARGLHHQRIALAGTLGWYFGYPLYGMDNSNQVDYVGHRGPHGSFRQISSCRAWRTAVDAGHFRYVVAAASRTMWTGAIRTSPEGGWTATDPHARLLFPHDRRPWFQVYALNGPLNPSSCPG